jgi:vacuolar-type H+-ATPase subunit H
MNDDYQEKRFPIGARGPARLGAEGRAKAAIDQAESRAEAVRSAADARAMEIIAEQLRRIQQLTVRAHGRATAPTPFEREPIVTEQADRSLTPANDPNQLRQQVSVHAYYKAEQRGFSPGQETEDWLEAESELLAVSSRDLRT